jgi:hypothetical protein
LDCDRSNGIKIFNDRQHVLSSQLPRFGVFVVREYGAASTGTAFDFNIPGDPTFVGKEIVANGEARFVNNSPTSSNKGLTNSLFRVPPKRTRWRSDRRSRGTRT